MPWLPVNPWQMTLVFSSISTAIRRSSFVCWQRHLGPAAKFQFSGRRAALQRLYSSNDFLGAIAKIVGRDHIEATFGDDPLAFIDIGAFQTNAQRPVFELGNEAGAGSAMKAVNQLLAGVHISVMAEALTFGISQGVTPAKFIEVISKCAGTSWMLENRAPHIVDGDYTPHSSVNIWPKDLGIVLDVAKNAKFDAPIASAALKQFKTAVDMGLGLEDDAAVVKVYAKSANLSLPKKL